MRVERILVVDDKDETRTLMRALLKGNGYEVDEAHHGAEALDVARRNPPDLVISDILMPTMNGFALCREWKLDERLKPIPFVFYTATYTDERDREFAMSCGADQFIVKPQEPEAFVAIIRKAIRPVGSPPAAPARLAAGTAPEEEAPVHLKQYNAALIRKLETKMEELEKDIAARKIVEASLRESEARFRSLVEMAPEGIFVQSEGRFVFLNPAMLRLLGAEAVEELLDKEFMERIAPEYRDSVRQRIRLQNETGISALPMDQEYLRLNGSRVPVETTAVPVQYHGRDAHMVFVRDVTERMRAWQAVQKSERLFRAITEKSYDGISMLNEAGTILFDSPSVERIMGYGSGERLGRNVFEFIHPDDRERMVEAFTVFAGQPERVLPYQGRFVHKNGAVRWTEGVRTNLLHEPAVRAIVVNFHDITDRKIAEESQSSYQRQLQSLASQVLLAEERERKKIAVQLHEGIGHSLTLVKMKLEAMAAVCQNDGSAEALRQLVALVEGTIDASISLSFELSSPILYELGLEAAIRWLVDRARQQHGLDATYSDDGANVKMSEDHMVLLFLVVRELMFNIVKHSQASHVSVTVRHSQDRITIDVSDDGRGFDQTARSDDESTPGNFGLFSIRERLASIGGTMVIESGVGKVTRIQVAAPLKKGQSMSIRVLLVDDHKVVREGLKSLVDKEKDMTVCGEAQDGRGGIDMCVQLRPDVIVLDISMPGLSGIEAAKQISAMCPDTRIVVLSIHSSRPFVEAMTKAGALAYVPKHCAFSELAVAIRQVMLGNVYVSPKIVADYHGKKPPAGG